MKDRISRRDFIRAGTFTLLGTAGAAVLAQAEGQAKAASPVPSGHNDGAMPMTVSIEGNPFTIQKAHPVRAYPKNHWTSQLAAFPRQAGASKLASHLTFRIGSSEL